MIDLNEPDRGAQPGLYSSILAQSLEMGFTMPSDIYIGTLLKALIASKPNSYFLEMGTGAGLSLAWMIDGMDEDSSLITLDNDPELIENARNNFGNDSRIEIVCADGAEWLRNYNGDQFDLIFADTWPGKYSDLSTTLGLIKPGGFYVIDDMLPQANWPEGHEEKAEQLIVELKSRNDFVFTGLSWSTGVVICTRKTIS